MRIIHCLITLLLFQTAIAQQAKRHVRYSGNGTREVFYALVADTQKLHGRYLRTDRNTRVEGFYKNGYQDGVWTEYALGREKFTRVQGPFKDGLKQGLWTIYSSKRKLKSKGFYQDDKRIGYWRFYNNNGEIEEEGNFKDGIRVGAWTFTDENGDVQQEYDYTANKVVRDKTLDSLLRKKFKVIDGSDTTLSLLDRPPIYVGGMAKMGRSKTIQYKMDHDSVKVQICFLIDQHGRAFNHRIVESMGQFYDREALFTATHLPPYWLPARLKGEPVMVEHTITVLFKKTMLKKEPYMFYRNYLPPQSVNPYNLATGQRIQQPLIPMYATSFSVDACKVQIF